MTPTLRFREYFNLPQNILTIPAGTLLTIEEEAQDRDGIVSFYISIPRQFPTPRGVRWQTVWQLLDYNIDTDRITKMYPYRMVVRGVTPLPDTDAPYFTAEVLPKPVLWMLRDKVHYYKNRAKKQ